MDTLQVVAEPRRREILRLIWADELSASDIAARFDVTFGAVSQHLSILRDAKLVTVRKDGNHRLYQADQGALAPYKEILESMWGEAMKLLSDAIEQEQP